ncbi:alkaline phosphatase D family protein [Alteromonas sp. KUL49]|uniref:alkaline phosphatase D family protein n=1 Tax=Alteromonas sp. KUL49 TaxID=2480798 RepID=UPI00102F1D09|nr:alkaline phosphatase D family protein [Alteromonas sp. KUL49]TAP37920.1 alkaline phosphatase [Alteromonas sp. KUL49]GEA12781.1 alkaline phosphatase [Alteromonas sp. KUL49]
MDRRRFLSLSTSMAASAALTTGIAGCVNTSSSATKATFTHGIASGDPLSDAVILWTRALPDDNSTQASVMWEVSLTSDFEVLIASGEAVAKQNQDFTIKVDVTGLTPATQYYYRFKSANNVSQVGQTLTLPEGDVDSVTFGVFSCSNYPAGYFTPYKLASEDTAIDYVLHLGDYIYEYSNTGYATERAEELGRTFPENNKDEIISLDDYRRRYALYRTDKGLLALHQNKPFIVVWDDHEITNDTYMHGAENHSADEGDFYERRAAAVQAYYEWLPIRPPKGDTDLTIYRQFTFGNLVNLYMLDTRVIGRDKQLSYGDYRNAESGEFDQQRFMKDISATDRSLLGNDQRTWLDQALQNGEAKWQVLGQQLLMGRMFFPASVFNGVPRDKIAAHTHQLANIKRKQMAGESLSDTESQMLAVYMPYNLDAWDGYPVERERLLMQLKTLGKPVIALAGDTHNAWHNTLTTQTGEAVATELATSSVSSPGMESYLSLDEQSASLMSEDLPILINDLKYCNLHQRGFLTVSFTQDEAKAVWSFVDSIDSLDTPITATHEITIAG